MKERPILFNGPMVRAILEGRKWNTRRAIKPQPTSDFTGSLILSLGYPASNHWTWAGFGDPEDPVYYKCPYGKPGDKLWVRETMVESSIGSDYPHYAGYKAGFPKGYNDKYDLRFYPKAIVYNDNNEMVEWWALWQHRDKSKNPPRTKSSIHMPRWASRITLDITDIRVERLQEISEEDAQAEGLKLLQGGIVSEFAVLWDSINGKKYPWSSNPWVWVIEFKRINHDPR